METRPTIVDITIGIFCVVYEESENHKKCKSVLLRLTLASALDIDWPWALRFSGPKDW